MKRTKPLDARGAKRQFHLLAVFFENILIRVDTVNIWLGFGIGGLTMADIKTKLNVGDTVWWVNCSNKVYKGTIKEIVCCDYQGALYCGIYSPSYRRNTNPVVHYSSVFESREKAQKFAEYQEENPDDVFPKCMGCHYNAFKED